MEHNFDEALMRVQNMKRLHTREEQVCYLDSLHQVLGDVERCMLHWQRLMTEARTTPEPWYMTHGEHSSITWLRNEIKTNGSPRKLAAEFTKKINHITTWPTQLSPHGPECCCTGCVNDRRHV